MRDLYDYESATEEECNDDLYDTICNISDDIGYSQLPLDAMERRAKRILNIIKRLKELKGE